MPCLVVSGAIDGKSRLICSGTRLCRMKIRLVEHFDEVSDFHVDVSLFLRMLVCVLCRYLVLFFWTIRKMFVTRC